MGNIKVERESIENIASSIRGKNHTTDKYTPSEMSGAIDSLPTYEPNTTLNITSNGTKNVSSYEYASVQVPEPSGTLSIISNGSYDVRQYAHCDVNTPSYVPDTTKTITSNGTGIDVSSYQYADVNVPQPSGSTNITTNGIHDVTNYETANVNVPESITMLDCQGFGYTYIDTDKLTNGYTDVENYFEKFNAINVTDSTMMFSNASIFSTINDEEYNIPVDKLKNFHPTNVNNMFNFSSTIGCTLFDTSRCSEFNQMFNNCQYIENLPLLDTSSAVDMVSMFQGVTNQRYHLTQTSVDNLLRMCINTTSAYTGTKTLKYVWDNNQSSIPRNLSTMAQNSTYYQDFLDSGWTL